MAKFLEVLDHLMKDRNMSRADLARAINIPPSTINSWYARNVRKVNFEVANKLASYFGITYDELLEGETPKVDGSLTFSRVDYTDKELEMIANFAKMLKESR